MKSISAALSAALGAPVSRPAVLVQADFTPVLRWSSHADLNWNGHTWAAMPLNVEGLQASALRLRGTLVLDNRDGTPGSLVLTQGIEDRVFRIWAYDAAATAAADVVWLADAIGASAQIDDAAVGIELRHRAELMLAPRQFITEPLLGPMLPLGAVLRINGQELTVSRRSNA